MLNIEKNTILTGEMHTLLYFNTTLSDNLISELAFTPPTVLNQPECRCPPQYPTTSELEDVCMGPHTDIVIPRLNENSHVPSFIIPRNPERWWESAPGDAPVNVTVSLGGLRASLSVSISYRTVLPQSMVLYYSTNGVDFEFLYRYESNCSRFSLLENGLVDNSTISNCSSLPLNNLLHTIRSEPLDNPGPFGITAMGSFAFTLDISQATHIRLELIEWSSDIALNEQSFAINELYVFGQKCMCNGHSDTCDDAVCSACSHNTTGAHCDQCLPLFNDQPWAPATPSSSNDCKPCNCNNHSISCSYNSTINRGVCDDCQHNTQGLWCEECIDNHYQSSDLTLSDPNICQPCHEECIGCTGPLSTDCIVSGVNKLLDCYVGFTIIL